MWFIRLLYGSCLLTALVQGFDTEVVVLRAVRGYEARLPCGQGRVFLDGPDSYVLWLKNDRDLLYRFPNEDTEKRLPDVGTPCHENSCFDETSLLLKHVTEKDAGIYRCRVHYQASPSVDYVIEVRLVDSPGFPRIFDANDNEVKGHTGPYSLGSDLDLICEVEDNQPDTLVYWRRNGALIERAHSVREGILRAEVHLRNMTRAELDAHYECLAQNADVTEPLTASVVIKMYLPPLSVEIRVNNNRDFEAGQPRVVDCVVVGCVPPPSISWHLGDSLLRSTVHKELHDGNYTVSSLTLVPSLRDNDQELSCRAHNSHLPAEVYRDNVKLHVGYRPVCLTSREETIGAVMKQAETVTCVVEASPEPMQFSWTFADTRVLYTSVQKVPGHHHRYTSTLTWLPRDSDYGPLLCRATNAFGEQKRGCEYTVSPGSAPLIPDCAVLRSYPNILRVQCKKGWDGGRLQTIHLEVYNEDTMLLHNVSNVVGHFQLTDLNEDVNLTAVVYASNIRGKSLPRTMHLQTLTPQVASAISDTKRNFKWSHWVEIGAGITIFVIALSVTVYCVRTMRDKTSEIDLNPDLVPRSDGTFHREPDFARDDRLLGTTNITVNQLASCQNQYSSTPIPSCRVIVGCGGRMSPDPNQQSYYV